jgi:hypothetical protein
MKPRFEARQLEDPRDPEGAYVIMTDAESEPIEGDDLDTVMAMAEQECKDEAFYTETDPKPLLARVYIAKVEVTAVFPWSESKVADLVPS